MGALSLGNPKRCFLPRELLEPLGQNKFNGLCTIILDSCFSGKWADELKRLFDQRDPVVQPLLDQLWRSNKTTYLNLRLACSSDEKSYDKIYTPRLIANLKREQKGSYQCGWGAKVWSQNPTCNDLVFASGQRDRAILFFITPWLVTGEASRP